MNQRTNQTQTNSIRTLAVDINGDGKRISINLGSIRADAFIAHHGIANNGIQVNSLHSTTIGKSTILRSGKNGPMIAATHEEMEVFATQYLTDKGFNVQKPYTNSGNMT